MKTKVDKILDLIQAQLNALDVQIRKVEHEQEFEEFFGMAALKYKPKRKPKQRRGRGPGRGRGHAKPDSVESDEQPEEKEWESPIPLYLPEPRPAPQFLLPNTVLTSRYLMDNVLKPNSEMAADLVEISRQEEATAEYTDEDGTMLGFPLLSTIPVSNKTEIKMKDTGEVLSCVIGWKDGILTRCSY